MRLFTRRLMPILFGAMLIGLPLGAHAAGMGDMGEPPGGQPPPGQQPPGQQPPAQQPPGTGVPGAAQPAQINEETIEKFAGAFSEILVIQETFTEKLEAAESNEDAQALQQEAQQEMVEAVQDNGLSVAEYNEVVAMMEQDPQLRERVLQMAN